MLRRGYYQTLGKYKGRAQSRSSLTGTLNMKHLQHIRAEYYYHTITVSLTHEGIDKVSHYSGGGRVIESEHAAEPVQTCQQN
jgi:hypothetical protein